MNEEWDPTAEAVIEGIRKAAAMDPDRVYAPPVNLVAIQQMVAETPGGWLAVTMNPMIGRCEYHCDRFGVGRDHACLVGASLYDLGFDPADYEPTGASDFIADVMGIYVDEGQGFWLDRVQHHQDNLVPWGQAVIRADAEFDGWERERARQQEWGPNVY